MRHGKDCTVTAFEVGYGEICITPALASSRERNCLVTPVTGSGYSR